LPATRLCGKFGSRFVNGLPVDRNGGARPYEAWEHFVGEKSRELAVKILLVTARHRRRLVPKQMLMRRFSKASMHLLAVESALWYASQQGINDRPLAHGLLTYFCSRVKEDFEPTPLLSTRTSCW